VEQPQYNLLVRQVVETDLAPLADRFGFGLVTWSPLRSGLLSGKYNDAVPADGRLGKKEYEWLGNLLNEPDLTAARGLAAVAGELGCTPAQLAIGWLLRLGQVTSVITGAKTMEQLEENLAAIEVTPRLTPEILAQINRLTDRRGAGG
jgi:aryl-alcohol dehydrogenase-like predicted oxidoreductase